MRLFKPHPAIAHHPDQLTVAWAQQIVNQHSANTLVEQVKITSVDIGTTTRVSIKVNHNGPDSLTNFWFVKLPSLSWRARVITALPRLLHTEKHVFTMN